MPLLRRAEKEVKISLEKRIEVFLTYLRQRNRFVATSRPPAIPIQRSDLPIKDLELALSPRRIYEAVGETIGEFGDDSERLAPAIVIK